jgi:Spy/CpxP family protein refolding chaperone
MALVTQPGIAQTAPPNELDAMRTALKTDKRAYVASSLALTPAQEKKFWPIYDTYQRALDVVARARAVTAESSLNRASDQALSNPAAKAFVTQLLVADEAEMKARRKMFNAAMRALPAAKAARYYQLEGKFRALQSYDIAQAFPLVN